MEDIKSIKNKVAIEMGYPNWDEFYNWISRDGEIPCVVAQQLEGAMEDVLKRMLIKTNQLGNEIGTHHCIKELTDVLDALLNHCNKISASFGEEMYNKLMDHHAVFNAMALLKKHTE